MIKIDWIPIKHHWKHRSLLSAASFVFTLSQRDIKRRGNQQPREKVPWGNNKYTLLGLLRVSWNNTGAKSGQAVDAGSPSLADSTKRRTPGKLEYFRRLQRSWAAKLATCTLKWRCVSMLNVAGDFIEVFSIVLASLKLTLETMSLCIYYAHSKYNEIIKSK